MEAAAAAATDADAAPADGGVRRRRRYRKPVVVERFGRQERTAMVRVGQHQRLDARKVLGRRKLSQVGVVEGLQVQQPVQALGGQPLENVLADVPADGAHVRRREKLLTPETVAT